MDEFNEVTIDEVSDLDEGRPFDDATSDLPAMGPALYASSSDAYMSIRVASASDAVTLDTIHNDIQLFNLSFLLAFSLAFFLFAIKGWWK